MVREGLTVLHDLVTISSIGKKEKDAASQEALEGAPEKLLLVEGGRLETWGVEFGELQGGLFINVLVEYAQRQHWLRCVEQVVHSNEHGLKEGLKQRQINNSSLWSFDNFPRINIVFEWFHVQMRAFHPNEAGLPIFFLEKRGWGPLSALI